MDRFTRLRNLSLLALAAGLFCASAAFCASGPPIAYYSCQVPGGRGAEVRVADRVAVRLYRSNGNLTPMRRAEIVVSRLRDRQVRGIPASSYRAEKFGSAWWVVSGSEKLVWATEAEAAVRRMSPRAVACAWAENLRKLLSLPPLFVDPDSVVVPLGESRDVEIGGWAEGPIEVLVDRTAVEARNPAGTRTLSLSGRELGEAIIELRQGSLTARLSVRVMKWAARLLTPQLAWVTGIPTDNESIGLAVANAVRRSVVLEEGASLQIAGSPEIVPGREGSSAVANVTASGPGLLERREAVRVPLIRVEPPSAAPEFLLYCNEPEKVSRPGPLFHSRVRRPCRLFVHHINVSGRPLNLSIYASSGPGEGSSFHVVGGSRSAKGDVIGTGLGAVSDFLDNFRARSGCVVSLGRGAVERIASMRMGHGSVASAVFDVTPLSGGRVRLTVVAESPDSTQAMGLGYHDGLGDSDHVYPRTTRRVLEEYVVGKRWAFVTLGKETLQNVDGQTTLRGDYGILYEIDVEVQNSHSESKRIVVEFEAAAGPAGVVAWVNGERRSVGRLASQKEATLTSLVIPPNAVRTIKIQTMPLGGSAYPARLIVRER